MNDDLRCSDYNFCTLNIDDMANISVNLLLPSETFYKCLIPGNIPKNRQRWKI